MKFLEEIDRLKRLDRLIRLKATGTPAQLATRLAISERTIFNEIDTLRAMGAPIVFCKIRQSYCYVYEIELLFGVVKPLKRAE